MAMEDEDDVLGSGSRRRRRDRDSTADKKKKTMAVNVVELGRPLEGGRNKGAAAESSSSRRRRKQTQVTKILRSSFGDKVDPRALRERVMRKGGTSKQQQQQQQTKGQHRREKSSGSAPWSDMKTQMRRRSRDAAEAMKRRISMSRGYGDNEDELKQLRDEAESRRQVPKQKKEERRVQDGSESRRKDKNKEEKRRQDKMDASRRRVSLDTDGRKDASRARVKSRDTDGSGRRNNDDGERKSHHTKSESGRERRITTDVLCKSSETQRLKNELAMRKRGSGSNRRQKLDRGMSKSTGHALTSTMDVDDDSIGSNGNGKYNDQRRMSKSMFEPSSSKNVYDLPSTDSEEEQAMPLPDFYKPARGSKKTERKRLNCGSSMDVAVQKLCASSPTKNDSERREGKRRNSLESSLKLGENNGLLGLLDEKYMNRRRSVSEGILSNSDRGDDLNEELKKLERRRSVNFGKKEDKELTDEDQDLLDQLDFNGKPRNSRSDQRKTYSAGISFSDNKNESASSKPKRYSENNIRDKGRSTIEMDTRDIMGERSMKRKTSQELIKKKKRGSSIELKNPEGAPKNTAATAETSEVDSASNHSVAEEDRSGSTKQSKTRSGCHVSRCMMAMACLCYLISVVLFCALGFWLHMTYVSYNDEDTSSSSSNGTVVPKAEVESAGLFEYPSPGPTSYNTWADESLEADLSSPSASPSLSPTSFPSEIPSITNEPSGRPSLRASNFPSASPTLQSSTVPSSAFPTYSPSSTPSFSPTAIPECPEQLLNEAPLGTEGLLKLRYEVILFPGDAKDNAGGLLCASLEYTGAAGWIGLAFSEASRAPQYGRKEAIIGIPGVQSSKAVNADGNPGLGQQYAGLEGGPTFVNPGKYVIPPGGVNGDGYYGPKLDLLSPIDMQTLVNASVSSMNSYMEPNPAVADFVSTKISFIKYLREPGEIEIFPSRDTLLLYAVAALPQGGSGEYNGNPDWQYTYLKFLESSSITKSELHRNRVREHKNANTVLALNSQRA
eukprot:CAMPEP_0183720986 /NCGR_PEP_ID=MMETSP0737-20130205/13442_1 /TAXON_ID=385413 /ORGANISM="Thalassiosira miniscula, Strain CCMP1093" /LENGTH=1009 /DNA_ID=CAMNT_0025950945 /DNA_START=38 /DNA_END=3067 /DNA_ORIENTATION=+